LLLSFAFLCYFSLLPLPPPRSTTSLSSATKSCKEEGVVRMREEEGEERGVEGEERIHK
jgi:hypothetical protein